MRLSKDSPPKRVEFNGVKYHLIGTRRYYLSYKTRTSDRKGAKGLHVAIWELYHKRQCPKGYHIHHKDGDTFNNDIENLECIQAEKHRKMPKNVDREKMLYNLDKIRPLTKKWHASPEGLQWHSENSKKAWKNRVPENAICIQCNGGYTTFFKYRSKFCSPKCDMAYARKTGKYWQWRVCAWCSKKWWVNYKYFKSETCSRGCSNRLQHKHRKG